MLTADQGSFRCVTCGLGEGQAGGRRPCLGPTGCGTWGFMAGQTLGPLTRHPGPGGAGGSEVGRHVGVGTGSGSWVPGELSVPWGRPSLRLCRPAGAHLGQEGVHVAGLEAQLGVGHGVGGIAPLLYRLKVLLGDISLRQVEPVDERQDVPGKRARRMPWARQARRAPWRRRGPGGALTL